MAASTGTDRARVSPDGRPVVEAADRAVWRAWLAEHHDAETGAWLVRYKKASAAKCVDYDAAVEEALCFGWIDGRMHPIDDEQMLHLFTPRRPRSTWSAVNKRRIEKLVTSGAMTPAGLAAIERAKANGSWRSIDDAEAGIVPDDLRTALRRNPAAAKNFERFSRSNKRGFLAWIGMARKTETRKRRIADTVWLASQNVPLQAGRELLRRRAEKDERRDGTA